MRTLLCTAIAMATLCIVATASAEWKEHTGYLLNGDASPIPIAEKLQIVTESWNRVVAVPYIVYMPEKDEILMLASCDYPHQAMFLSSRDHGTTWSAPHFAHVDAEGKPDTGMGTSLTYLGNGNVVFVGSGLWFSSDYGETWANPIPVPPASDGKPWYMWDPLFVDKAASDKLPRIVETGYTSVRPPETGPGYQQAYVRFSDDCAKTWTDCVKPPEWEGVSEVALVRAKNGGLVGACRTDIPARMKGETLDHYEGLGISISKDNGKTWSPVAKLFDWGRHHPAFVLMPDGTLVMTYVVRKGYVDSKDGLPQFGIEAVVSRDNGQTWDLDHRYVLDWWIGNRTGPNGWWASCQATSSVLLPDGSILTTFGTGYRSQPNEKNMPTPRDVGLVSWKLSDQPTNADRKISDAPFDSDTRNKFDPATLSPR